MTTDQLHWFNALYLAILVVVAFATRATARRIAGALAGASVAGLVGLASIEVGERAGWWHIVFPREPGFLALLWVDFALSAFIFLGTWRLARRFGGRGLAVVLAVAVVFGPIRDYAYMRHYPEWGAYAPGPAPALAVAVLYGLIGVVGHGVMRWVAGPAGADRLARSPRPQA